MRKLVIFNRIQVAFRTILLLPLAMDYTKKSQLHGVFFIDSNDCICVHLLFPESFLHNYIVCL